MKKIFALVIFFTNLLICQTVSISIIQVNSEGREVREEKMDTSLVNNFISYLQNSNREDMNTKEWYGNDTIQIKILVGELKLEGTAIKIVTNNLQYQTAGHYWKEYFKDTKTLYLLRTYLVHLSSKVWSYPTSMTTKKMDNFYYVHYVLPDKKELYLTYYNYNDGKLPAYFSLRKVECYQINDIPKTTKKQKTKPPKGQWIETDFIALDRRGDFDYFYTDYNKYAESFYRYTLKFANVRRD